MTWHARKAVAGLAVGFALNLPAPEAMGQAYVRVGIVAAVGAQTRFTDVDCESVTPAALYGCGAGGDGEPLSTAGEFGSTAALSLGAGYALGPATRVELVLEYRPAVPFEGRANFLSPEREQSVRTRRSSNSGTVAVKFDLASLGVPQIAGLRAFAGAGIGRVRHRLGETTMTFPRTQTIVPGASSTDWTWMLTAGLSRTLSERTVLDVAWRYADEGEAFTGEGAGSVRWRDGSRTLALDLPRTRGTVGSHGIWLSVRYEV